VVLRKWLNIGNGLGDSDFSADECGPSDGDTDREGHLPPSSSYLSPPCVIGRKLFWISSSLRLLKLALFFL
jgi:hypothetical protein